MFPIPCAYLVLAVLLGVLSPALDRALGTRGVGVDGARDVLSSTATGMIAFTGLVVSSVLLLVQFAASQYSPRLVLWFRHDRLVKNAIGSFLAVPVFALVALSEIERKHVSYAQDVTLVITLALLVGAALLFLALLQRVLDRLRPRSLYSGVAREGIRAARRVYPARLEPGGESVGDEQTGWRRANSRELPLTGSPGALASFDRALLVTAAERSGVTLELVPAIGEFVARGAALLRVHGSGSVDEFVLRGAVFVSEERAIDNDPAFALRIIVDTAIRALSPAVNDPTTAVHALDALEVLMGDLAIRDLGALRATDEHGATRLVWRAAGWADLLGLAFDEIRAYGAGSVQICRRLRALLEDLRAASPTVRHSAIDVQRERLEAAIERAHPAGSPELAIARGADRLGLGLERHA